MNGWVYLGGGRELKSYILGSSFSLNSLQASDIDHQALWSHRLPGSMVTIWKSLVFSIQIGYCVMFKFMNCCHLKILFLQCFYLFSCPWGINFWTNQMPDTLDKWVKVSSVLVSWSSDFRWTLRNCSPIGQYRTPWGEATLLHACGYWLQSCLLGCPMLKWVAISVCYAWTQRVEIWLQKYTAQ